MNKRQLSQTSEEISLSDVKLERSVRSVRHQTPEVQQFLETVRRGRGRPRKVLSHTNSKPQQQRIPRIGQKNVRRVSPRVSDGSGVSDGNSLNMSDISSSSLLTTVDNKIESPPKLIRQTMDIDERVINVSQEPNDISFNRMEAPVGQNNQSVNEELIRGQKCYEYVESCKVLTQKIQKEGLNQNLMTVLKYYLMESNLGNIDLCIDSIRKATENMSFGVAFNIENPSVAKQREGRNGQNGSQQMDHSDWNPQSYTPQINYNQK